MIGSKRLAGVVALLLWCVFTTHIQAVEAFPTTIVTEASVSDTEGPDVWVSMDVYSEQPFLYSAAGRTIFTHPDMPFGAQIDSYEFEDAPDSVVYQKRQIFGYSAYQPTAALSDGVSDVAAAFLPYELVSGVVFWKNGTLDRTFPTRISYMPLYMAVQSRASDGTIFTSTYPLAPDLIQTKTSVYDFLNATYEISLYYYQSGQPTVPVPDTETRVGFFTVHYPTQTLLYATPWVTTNAQGRADSTMGTGAYTIPITGNVPLDKLTVRIDPLTEDGTVSSNAYIGKELVIDNMAAFDGELTVTVLDVDGSPLRAVVQCLGGPVGSFESPVGKTDTDGEVTLRIPNYGSGSDTRSLEAHLPPDVLVVSNLTQFVDNMSDGELHAKAPAYFSPHLQLMAGAYTYKNKAPSDPIVRVYANGTQEGGDFDSQKIKRDEDYTRGERMTGVNRLFYPVTPGESSVDYTCRVYFEDNDEGAAEDEMRAGDSDYTPRKVSEARVPESDTPLHFQYVGVVGLGTPRTGRGSVLSRNLSGVQQAEWNTFLQKLVPHDVVFTNGPDVTPGTSFYEVDGYRLGGVFRELENWRRAQTTHIDVVVGIVAPGGASSYLTGGASGLSLPGSEHVVLIDPSGGLSHNKHILLHEFLHTLGLDDELGAPPSANGYDPETGRVVYNGMGVQTAQAIMFDAATEAWPTKAEYETLLNKLTLPLIALTANKAKAAGATTTRVMQISAMLHRVPFDMAPGVYQVQIASRAPVFIDTAMPYAPTEAPPNNGMNGRAYGLVTMTEDYNTLVRAYELLPAPTVNDEGDPPLDEALVGFINFAIPWDDATRTISFGAFDYSGAMSGGVPKCEIERSANAPSVAWTSKPSNGTTLSDQVTFKWEVSDPDYKPTLYAWVKISTDGGATWRAVGNYFPIEEGVTDFTLDCDLFPSASNCRIKVLVSDDWYTQTIEAGPYVLNGYDPNPVATLDAASYSTAARAPSVVTFPMVVHNTGRAELTLDLQTASLPAWANLVGAKTDRRIVPGGEASFFFSCSSTVVQTLSGTISASTNDPANGTLAWPVSITFDNQNHAPEALWLKAWGLGDGERTPVPDSIVFLAQEASGRSDLDALLTIHQRFPADHIVASDLAMESGQMPGEYRLDWLPGSLEQGRYGVEVVFADVASGMSDDDGTNPSGDDFTFEIVGENHAPVFSNIAPETDLTSYFAVLGGDNFELSFDVSDPDGDALSLSLDCAMSADLDVVAGTIAGITETGKVGHQTIRLVATDPYGAQTTAVWYMDVEPPWVPDLARAVPYISGGTVVSGDTFCLRASCYNLDPQQGCRIAYRPEGATDWTTLGTAPYSNQEYYVQYTNDYYWNVTHLAPGAPCEVRYTNIDASGQADPNPPIVVIRRQVEDAVVMRVSAPTYLWPGQRFTLVVEVRNDSTQTWTSEAGYRLAAQGGVDSLTGESSIMLPAGLSVPPGAVAVYSLDATAPMVSGYYRTAWQHSHDGLGAYGSSGAATVGVFATIGDAPSQSAAWTLYH